jgi:hypothetical protein
MITLNTADQLTALALHIFNPEITPNSNPVLGDHWGAGVGLTAQDDATDARLYALIAPVALAIDGRTVPSGFKYTLNVTNALQLRPKHFYMDLSEHDSSGYGWPASVMLNFKPQPGFVSAAASGFSWGGSIGLATCAAICTAWAAIIKLWLQGQYPLAVSQP